MMLRPSASRALALASTSNADSVPRTFIRSASCCAIGFLLKWVGAEPGVGARGMCLTRGSACYRTDEGPREPACARLPRPMADLPEELAKRPPRKPWQEPSSHLTIDAYLRLRAELDDLEGRGRE